VNHHQQPEHPQPPQTVSDRLHPRIRPIDLVRGRRLAVVRGRRLPSPRSRHDHRACLMAIAIPRRCGAPGYVPPRSSSRSWGIELHLRPSPLQRGATGLDRRPCRCAVLPGRGAEGARLRQSQSAGYGKLRRHDFRIHGRGTFTSGDKLTLVQARPWPLGQS
jgi:hypothetical protein